VRALVAGGADVNGRSWGETPLTCAAAHGHARVIAALLESGADPNATNADGVRVAYVAAVSNEIDAVDLLVDSGAEVGGDEAREALHQAACDGRLELVRTLLAAGADASNLPLLDVLKASRDWETARRVEMLRELIDAGAEVAVEVAEMALSKDDEAFTALVLERGLTAGTISPSLLVKEMRDDRAVCRALDVMVGLGIDVHEPAVGPPADQPRPPLLLATEGCRFKVVRCLLATPGSERWRQVAWREVMQTLETVATSTFSKCSQIADLLIESGADPSATDEEGRTLLFTVDWENASHRYHLYIFDLGIDVNHRDAAGRTALDEAVAADTVVGVETLLANGAEPQDKSVLEWVARRIQMHPEIGIRMKLKNIKRSLEEADRARAEVETG
jgi:ankyrin repeat protein